MIEDIMQYEITHWSKGEFLVAGIDEAGRGPLAGPVVAACVIMPHNNLIEGINDSKKLSEKKREQLYELIIQKAIDYNVSIVDNNVIDEINILRSARLAFENALNGMKIMPVHVYTDYMDINTDIPYTSLAKGDSKVYNIAAASIVAKVTRDAIMREYDKMYPLYMFAKHKGYGTKIHVAAIKEYGASPIHRKTFLKKI